MIRPPSVLLGVALAGFGGFMLWLRFNRYRNRFTRAMYAFYEKTVRLSVDAYLLVGGVLLITLGSLLAAGFLP